MTNKDVEVIEFLKTYKVATTDMLSQFIFNSKHTCYKRLHKLYVDGKVKRLRLVNGKINSEYLYYINKLPNQLKHAITIMEFYSKWAKKYYVVSYDIQVKMGEIIPDAIMVYIDTKTYESKEACVEIELSNKGFNYLKYENFIISGEYKKYLKTQPEIIVYGNAKIPTGTKAKYRIIKKEEKT